MNEIDPNVIEALEKMSDDDVQSLTVLISCEIDTSQKLAKKLSEHGVKIRKIMQELDILVADINKPHLSVLQSDKHICAVEVDKEISIFQNDNAIRGDDPNQE